MADERRRFSLSFAGLVGGYADEIDKVFGSVPKKGRSQLETASGPIL